MSENKITNFHTHTLLCNHASGMPADYAARAEKDGCAALGFSDHCPYPEGSGDYWPDIRMKSHEALSYIQAVRSAASSVNFPVYAGFECEWDRVYESWYKEELLGTLGADYIAFGPHWVTLGSSHVYAMDIGDAATLHKYIDQTIDGIRSGIYAFVAHPDLFMGRWKEWDSEAQACLSALLDAAIACNVPVEVNGLGMTRTQNRTKRGMRYQYPYEEFWLMAAERGAKVICNADAHDPADVITAARNARTFAAQFGITPVESPFA
ncbi:MAG TPA: histidinol-phosphatase [Treponema sp.]|nr:histidinol-phosphatase [Treponema sp.]